MTEQIIITGAKSIPEFREALEKAADRIAPQRTRNAKFNVGDYVRTGAFMLLSLPRPLQEQALVSLSKILRDEKALKEALCGLERLEGAGQV